MRAVLSWCGSLTLEALRLYFLAQLSLDGSSCAHLLVHISLSRDYRRMTRNRHQHFIKGDSLEAAIWPIGQGRLGNVVFALVAIGPSELSIPMEEGETRLGDKGQFQPQSPRGNFPFPHFLLAVDIATTLRF